MSSRALFNETFRIEVVPEIGGSIVGCSITCDGERIPLLRQVEQPLTASSGASSFVLIPYSNRLRDGRFAFEGMEYQLRGPDVHAIHGDVRNRPLRVLQYTPTRIVMEFVSHDFDDVNFPFPFASKITYALEGPRFSSHIEVTNTGHKNMPAGCGFHPYFNRWLPGSTGEVEIQLTVDGVYPGETPLPTGPAVPLQPDQDLRIQRPLPVGLDHCFAGWNREAVIDWPGSGIRARLNAREGMEHVILYSPRDRRYFALEPVTNANDGFNLFAKGDRNCGVVVLRPGEVLASGFEITIEF